MTKTRTKRTHIFTSLQPCLLSSKAFPTTYFPTIKVTFTWCSPTPVNILSEVYPTKGILVEFLDLCHLVGLVETPIKRAIDSFNPGSDRLILSRN